MACRKTRSLLERFQEKVEISKDNEWNGSPCWDWMAARNPQGYGRIQMSGRSPNPQGAHRISWELYRGEIPEGLHVLHRCDRPCCVNPEHLFLGTNKDNVDDKVAKGRQRNAKGSSHGNALLTESSVRLVKQFLRRHNRSACGFLGRWFGVTREAISDIKNGRSWSHVE